MVMVGKSYIYICLYVYVPVCLFGSVLIICIPAVRDSLSVKVRDAV